MKRFTGQIHNYGKDFLQSDWWKGIRARFYSKKNTIKVCFICGTDKDLNLHHRSYKKMRHNTTNNLICLCRDCHHSIHFDKNGNRKQPSFKLNAYIQLSVGYMRERGLYPTHLLRYERVIAKFLK